MPQMGPLGWAWVSFLVVFVYLFYLVVFYYFYFVYFSFSVKEVGGKSWLWGW